MTAKELRDFLLNLEGKHDLSTIPVVFGKKIPKNIEYVQLTTVIKSNEQYETGSVQFIYDAPSDCDY